MRTPDQRLLNAVQSPQAYSEVVLRAGPEPLVLSVWDAGSQRSPVLFLPGTMTHPLFYEDFLDALLRAGHTVVGLHYRRHGKSPRRRGSFTFDDLVGDARRALVWTADRTSRPVAVLGSSQGGAVAMALAASRPAGLESVIAHNVLDPELSASLGITRVPAAMQRFSRWLSATLVAMSRVAPSAPVPVGAYLDLRRVCRQRWTAEQFLEDPIGLRSYPLGFLATLVTADLSGMRDGSIDCPVTVLASRGDPLFTLDYTRAVYERIVAPSKQLVVLDSDCHLVLNEALDVAVPAVLTALADDAGFPAEGGAA